MEEIQQWGPLDPSIHKALASLDRRVNIVGKGRKLRSTRLSRASTGYVVMGIELVTLRSTRLSRASTSFTAQSTGNCHFDPQGSREPRRKNAQLFLHLCHIYMLHIIHLLQIVYQVEISSRNLIVFSGQL